MAATGIVGHVGRKGLRLALTDGAGGLLANSMRQYDVEHSSSVSGALATFQYDLDLGRLPERFAIAVAGLARGDAISITQTRWFVSRSGLQAMLGLPPLILNDFEAEAWALSGCCDTALLPAGAVPLATPHLPGTYCVLGMTSGLGVSVFVREGDGKIHVLATEAGHAGFAPASKAMAELIAAVFPNRFPVVAEHLISANGLLAIYNWLAGGEKSLRQLTKPEDITRSAGSNPLAAQACDMLSEAFWSYASNLVLTYGTWDGIIITGKLAMALRQTLTAEKMQHVFKGTGKYARLLASVPRAMTTLDNGALIGAVRALHHYFD